MAANAPPLLLPEIYRTCLFPYEGKRLLVASIDPTKMPGTIQLCTPQQKAMKLYRWVTINFTKLMNFCAGRLSPGRALRRFAPFDDAKFQELEKKRKENLEKLEDEIDAAAEAPNTVNSYTFSKMVNRRNALMYETREINARTYEKFFIVLVVNDANLIEGFAFVDSEPTGVDIDVLCSAKKGAGTGTVLLNFIKKVVADMGKPEIRLTSVRASKSFYEKHGFTPVDPSTADKFEVEMVFRL